ncbi:unnamed protein product [Oikopleura dioica]|uniref:Uncharacterized protein n=1 Tax=Oikopleura dioica TaxID=34765 RepID=E4YGX1_OIKDI|nr:unnamed protein product [Oikopleura dioica]
MNFIKLPFQSNLAVRRRPQLRLLRHARDQALH